MLASGVWRSMGSGAGVVCTHACSKLGGVAYVKRHLHKRNLCTVSRQHHFTCDCPRADLGRGRPAYSPIIVYIYYIQARHASRFQLSRCSKLLQCQTFWLVVKQMHVVVFIEYCFPLKVVF